MNYPSCLTSVAGAHSRAFLGSALVNLWKSLVLHLIRGERKRKYKFSCSRLAQKGKMGEIAVSHFFIPEQTLPILPRAARGFCTTWQWRECQIFKRLWWKESSVRWNVEVQVHISNSSGETLPHWILLQKQLQQNILRRICALVCSQRSSSVPHAHRNYLGERRCLIKSQRREILPQNIFQPWHM